MAPCCFDKLVGAGSGTDNPLPKPCIVQTMSLTSTVLITKCLTYKVLCEHSTASNGRHRVLKCIRFQSVYRLQLECMLRECSMFFVRNHSF